MKPPQLPGAESSPTPPSPAARLRAGLRRHGVIPRPPEIRRLLRAPDVRLTRGNAVHLYTDGGAGLAAMLEALGAARRRIHFETYIFRSDATGRRFASVLGERARAGVEVRLLVDALGARGLDPALSGELRGCGADVVLFNPLTRLLPRWAPRRRDHRKILVVDGEVAFTGGLNVGDEYALGPLWAGRRVPWRDLHVGVRGPAVRMLEAVFLESWFRADGPDRPWLDFGGEAATAAGDQALAVLADGPTYHRRRVRDLLIAALERTRRRALLATPYFVPGRSLRRALERAAERGVEVELLTAGYSDHPSLVWASHALLPRLLEQGVRAFEVERSMMHAKVAVFDEETALLGTSNLDHQSLHHSYEVNLIAEGGSLPQQLAEQLGTELAEARPLAAEALARRSLPVRIRDRLAALVAGARR
jgi:cardiolipin synthase